MYNKDNMKNKSFFVDIVYKVTLESEGIKPVATRNATRLLMFCLISHVKYEFGYHRATYMKSCMVEQWKDCQRDKCYKGLQG